MNDKKLAEWKGIPREEIDWHPTIYEKRCVGCGMCVTSCGRNVFDFDGSKDKSVVARPNNCMVGCTTCQTYCLFDAISFPERELVRNIIKERGLLKAAKEELAGRTEDRMEKTVKTIKGGNL